PPTIGAFYDTIATGFTTVNPIIDPNANFVNIPQAVQIKSVADALAAIARIKAEGEGTQGSPDQPPPDQNQFAHYHVFKEIFVCKRLQQTNGQWGFTGTPIAFPAVSKFTQSSQQPDPSLAFNKALSQLLIELQTCWTAGAKPNHEMMFDLQTAGKALIQQGIRPEFLWAEPSAAQMKEATRRSHLAPRP